MVTSRRRFIFMSLLTTLWGCVGRVFGQTVAGPVYHQELCAWLEVLIPSDSISPGAGALHVEVDLIQFSRETPQRYKLLRAGVHWVIEEAKQSSGRRFSELSTEQAEAIVAKAADSELGTLPRAFFAYSFREGKRIYYTKPESWQGLGIARPPQPMGYMDYQEVIR